jgi:hypothetical protein
MLGNELRRGGRCGRLKAVGESPSLVLVINDAKLLIPCVKCFELGSGHKIIKEMVHGHEMTIMVEMHMK